MIKKRTLNQFYYESPDDKRYYFDGKMREHSNIGMTPVKFIEDFGPQQNGTTIRDWRLNPRTIQLDIFEQGDSCCLTRGELLAELIDIIRPNRGASRDVPGWLRFFNDATVLMEIPVFILQGLTGDFNYGGAVGRHQILETIQFYAADPIWREVEKQSILTTFEQTESCLPACVSFAYSAIGELPENVFCLTLAESILSAINVNYTGTWDGDQIDITLVGPMTNPVITNLTQGTRIELVYTIPVGDSVTITIRPEYVTVLDNHGRNLIGSISNISDLVDFVFLCPGEVTPTGLNIISVFAFNPDYDETQILIEYWTRHISAYGNPQCT